MDNSVPPEQRVSDETGLGAVSLPNLQDMVGFQLRLAQIRVFQDFADLFADFKLKPAEFSLLVTVHKSPGQVQKKVAAILHVQPANMVALVTGLRTRGLIEQRLKVKDRRAYGLHLTAEGDALLHAALSVFHAHEQRLVDTLGGSDQKNTLLAALIKLGDLPD